MSHFRILAMAGGSEIEINLPLEGGDSMTEDTAEVDTIEM